MRTTVPSQVLHDIDFTVEPGTCTAIVGESGSGKTTLARCLIGLHGDWTGDATFGDERLEPAAAKRSPDQRRRLQFVFQNPFSSLNPSDVRGGQRGGTVAVLHEAVRLRAHGATWSRRWIRWR